jgi:hypothetical protein
VADEVDEEGRAAEDPDDCEAGLVESDRDLLSEQRDRSLNESVNKSVVDEDLPRVTREATREQVEDVSELRNFARFEHRNQARQAAEPWESPQPSQLEDESRCDLDNHNHFFRGCLAILDDGFSQPVVVPSRLAGFTRPLRSLLGLDKQTHSFQLFLPLMFSVFRMRQLREFRMHRSRSPSKVHQSAGLKRRTTV